MKRIILIACIIAATISCTKEAKQTKPTKLTYNITVQQTKAVKQTWESGDVILIYFRDPSATGHLELEYSGTAWEYTLKDGLTDGKVASATDKKITAIYLPFGSVPYNGWFLQAENVTYTIEGTEVTATLDMRQPELAAGEALVQFYVADNADGFNFYQDAVKPINITGINADGTVNYTEGTAGDAIPGYPYEGGYIFSGALEASAVGKEQKYDFSLDDATNSTLYTKTAGQKTISANTAISLGTLSSWAATEYVDLGLPSGVLWTKCNVGAATPLEYGNYLTWEEAMASVHGLLRLPTMDEFEELISESDEVYALEVGYLDRAEFIFYPTRIILPAAGYKEDSVMKDIGTGICYWTSTTDPFDEDVATCLSTNNLNALQFFEEDRTLGFQVRAVLKR